MNELNFFENEPTSWKDLQDKVDTIFTGCGYHSEKEKIVSTVRGSIEIDVYADKKFPSELLVFCECKFWKKNIPQTVAHAFRTVVGDAGASKGIIISKKGFQKGVYDAIEKTNIEVLNWIEFQDKYKFEWLTNIIDRNYKLGRKIMNFGRDMINFRDDDLKYFSNEDSYKIAEIRENDFHFLTFREHYLNLNTEEICLERVAKMIESVAERKIFIANSLSQYFEKLYSECERLLSEMVGILAIAKERSITNTK
jgi:hypothetical protein